MANWPTTRGTSAVLDVGANVICDADRLRDFAVMGAAYHHAVHGSIRPHGRTAECRNRDRKGARRRAGRRSPACGREHSILTIAASSKAMISPKARVDVVVTDGFTGNVALKTAEGLARFFRTELQNTFTSSLRARLGALVAMRALKQMRRRLDPSGINGGPFLGLNGIVVKSHGGTDARGFATAIRLAGDLAESDFSEDIERNLNGLAGAGRGANRQGAVLSSIQRSVITGVGGYLPAEVVTNDDLAKIVDTRRRLDLRAHGHQIEAASGAGTSDLRSGHGSRQERLARRWPHRGRGRSDRRRDDHAGSHLPGRGDDGAAKIGRAHRHRLRYPGGLFRLHLRVVDRRRPGQRRSGPGCALVIGAETMTRLMDWEDRTTCVLFGDGAGAVVLEPGVGEGTTSDRGILGFCLKADGTKQDLLYVDGGPSTTGTVGKLRMQGHQVFRHAVVNITEAVIKAAEVAGIELSDVDWFIPHQANQRILGWRRQAPGHR